MTRSLIHRLSAAIAGALLLAALPFGLQAQTTTPVAEKPFVLGIYGKGWWNLENVIFAYAKAAGAFSDAGLDVTFEHYGDIDEFTTALYRGDVDAVSFLKTAQLCHEGREGCDLVISVITNQLSPYFVMVRSAVIEEYRAAGGLAEALYRDPDDPTDWKPVAAADGGCNGTPPVLYKTVVQKRYPNLDAADIYCGGEDAGHEANAKVVLRSIGNSGKRRAALASGTADIGVTYIGTHQRVRNEFAGVIDVVSTLEDIKRDFDLPMTGLVTREGLSEQKTCAFMQAYRVAAKRWLERPEEARQYLINDYYLGLRKGKVLSEADANELYEVLSAMMPLDGTISSAVQKHWTKTMFADQDKAPSNLFSFPSCS